MNIIIIDAFSRQIVINVPKCQEKNRTVHVFCTDVLLEQWKEIEREK